MEAYLAVLVPEVKALGREKYWFTFYGSPSDTEPYGWQIEGHHIVINYFVLGDQVVMTPIFMGSEPNYNESGENEGLRTFVVEEKKGLDFYKNKKPIGFVCHAPAALIKVKDENGEALVKGKMVTGFSNAEEEAVQLTKVVPFLLEDELKKLGALYSNGADWSSYTKQDGLLITGQNPASSAAVATLLLAAVNDK